MEASKTDHLLALKVMRLTKPSFAIFQPVILDKRDIGFPLMETSQEDITCVEGLPDFTTSQLLTLPQNFGNIFLGETFSCYVSIHNDSNQIVENVIVKADLQTSTQRLTLSNSAPTANPELLPGASLDDVINHEVMELGAHILICSVTYNAPSGEKLYFRKFFKFQVLRPLDVKTKFYNAQLSDDIYLEAHIQNTTAYTMYIDRVTFEPSELFQLRDHNKIEDKRSTFGALSYLNPNETRQYIYCLTPDRSCLKNSAATGKLDICWKTNLGERGHLQTSQLICNKLRGFDDLRVFVDSIPDVVDVDRTFNIDCKVMNCSDELMELTLYLNNAGSIRWSGVSGKRLGTVAPRETILVRLSLLAIESGFQNISGLTIIDSLRRRTYEQFEFAHVYVKPD